MNKSKKRMLMFWIAREYHLFSLIDINLEFKPKYSYQRLWKTIPKVNFINTAIATEINRIINKEIDIVTMCQEFTEDEYKDYFIKFLT